MNLLRLLNTKNGTWNANLSWKSKKSLADNGLYSLCQMISSINKLPMPNKE